MPATNKNTIRRPISLQNKVLTLTLAPLLTITTLIVSIVTIDRIEMSKSALEEQRESLINARQESVKDTVDSAISTLRPLINANPNSNQTKEEVKSLLRNTVFDNGNYVFVYDFDGTNLVTRPSPHQEGTNMLSVVDPNGKHPIRDLISIAKGGGGFYQYDWSHPGTGNIEPKYSYSTSIDEWEWMVGAGAYVTAIDAKMAEAELAAFSQLRSNIIKTISIAAIAFIIVSILAVFLVRRTIRPIRETAAAMKDIANGNGDLTKRLSITSHDEVGELAKQFNAFVSKVQETLKSVRISSDSVYTGAREVEKGNEELAARTEQSAANLQETSASMEEISSTVINSSEAASQADALAKNTTSIAKDGQAMMMEVENMMKDISESSAKISDIITTIDSIAFQTNLLALNASVEAAHAGDQGRGFAVVAQEVRNLASRSRDASQDIRELVNASTKHTQSGAKLVINAVQKMQEIVSSTGQVSDVISEISAGAKEQSAGVVQVNAAVGEMDTMTQENSVLVQQSSAAARNMAQHSHKLRELLNSFILDNGSITHQQATSLRANGNLGSIAQPTPPLPAITSRRHTQTTEEEWAEF